MGCLGQVLKWRQVKTACMVTLDIPLWGHKQWVQEHLVKSPPEFELAVQQGNSNWYSNVPEFVGSEAAP